MNRPTANKGIRHSALRNGFPYSVLPKKYRTEIPYYTKILYATVRYRISLKIIDELLTGVPTAKDVA